CKATTSEQRIQILTNADNVGNGKGTHGGIAATHCTSPGGGSQEGEPKLYSDVITDDDDWIMKKRFTLVFGDDASAGTEPKANNGDSGSTKKGETPLPPSPPSGEKERGRGKEKEEKTKKHKPHKTEKGKSKGKMLHLGRIATSFRGRSANNEFF